MNKLTRAVSALLLVGLAGAAAAAPVDFHITGAFYGSGTLTGDIRTSVSDQTGAPALNLPVTSWQLSITNAGLLNGTYTQASSNYAIDFFYDYHGTDYLEVADTADSQVFTELSWLQVPLGGSSPLSASSGFFDALNPDTGHTYRNNINVGSVTESAVGAPAGVPAPASFGLLGLGLLGFLGRRKLAR